MHSAGGTGRALLAAVAIALTVACGGASNAATAHLTGAGSSFDNPLFSKAFFDYTLQHPDVTVNYQPVGSGAGIQQFIKNTVDFGATDVPMGSADITSAGGADALTQIPVTLGVVAIAFNLSGVSTLNLDADTLAGMFLGHINKWNDPKIAALNAGVSLPNKNITIAHRSDGSGTTYILTDYLSKVSDEWKTKAGTSKSVSWPVGIGASGNQAVAQAISSTDGSIGYVELAYAVQTNVHTASLKNANGKFVSSCARRTATRSRAARL
ncbi:MAG: phosphate ABC transporter substrate-binding protein PstS [Actinobacteria bacterium 13_2_20CM_2_66_6]|nr:MAG: phosphate ABC transporter substrate-binding protein PstS [Actinobacteria bacterium 13_2_20CM_2_66_6]